jgi:hypothetical protein
MDSFYCIVSVLSTSVFFLRLDLRAVYGTERMIEWREVLTDFVFVFVFLFCYDRASRGGRTDEWMIVLAGGSFITRGRA